MRGRFVVRSVMVLMALALLVPDWAAAQHTRLAVGVIVGEPTGVSGKLWLSHAGAVDAAAAWSFVNQGAVHLHADYLLHNHDLIKVESGTAAVYYGLGGRLKFGTQTSVGVRIPVGIEYLLAEIPVGVFAELGPVLDLAPSTKLRFNGAIGARYRLP